MREIYFVYGKDDCPYCELAVNLINRHGGSVAYMNLSDHPEWRPPEWKTVPQIYRGGQYIGGYVELTMELGE